MTDPIERQAAIDAVRKLKPFVVVEPGTTCVLGVGIKPAAVVEAIDTLPSARRTGRWKVSDLPKGKMKYCSECGFGQYIADERQYNFCPNCGAEMTGGERRTDDQQTFD